MQIAEDFQFGRKLAGRDVMHVNHAMQPVPINDTGLSDARLAAIEAQFATPHKLDVACGRLLDDLNDPHPCDAPLVEGGQGRTAEEVESDGNAIAGAVICITVVVGCLIAGWLAVRLGAMAGW